MAPVSQSRDEIELSRLRREFTGRESLITTFEELLRHPPPVPILAFFGIGGGGKTWLINYLLEIHAQRSVNDGQKHIHALINFRPGHTATGAPDSLWLVRTQLTRQSKHLSFSRFDLVWGALWEKTQKMSIRNNTALLPEEIEQLADILGSLEDIPYLGKIVKIGNLVYENLRRGRDWQNRRKIADWVYKHVSSKKPTGWAAQFETGAKALRGEDSSRLESLLPIALAADLAENSGKRSGFEKILIFIDTYEYLEEGVRRIFGPDKKTYVETLAEELERSGVNVLLTIASRNKLRWAETQRHDGQFVIKKASLWASDIRLNDKDAFISRHLWQFRVDALSDLEAEEYLRTKCGIEDATLVAEIIKITAGYPLALATIAQLVRDGAEAAADELANLKARVWDYPRLSPQWRDEICAFLLERIFEQLKRRERNDLISLMRVAAVPRWFDGSLLIEISPGEGIREKIIELAENPFIELHSKLGPRGLATYSVHPVVRKLLLGSFGSASDRIALHERARSCCQRARTLCPAQEDGFTFELEEIYHAAEIDRAGGYLFGERVFNGDLEQMRFDRCESILRTLWEVDGWPSAEEAQILYLAGRLQIIQGDYEAALKNLKRAKHLEPLAKGFIPYRVKIAYHHAECNRLAGHYFEALQDCDELREMGVRYGSNFTVTLADWRASLIYKLLDEVPKALDICERLEVSRDTNTNADAEAILFGVRSPLVQSANFRRHGAELRRYIGDYVGAAHSLEYCLSVYSPESLEYAYTQLSFAHLFCMEGKWEEAWRETDRADAAFARILVDKRGILSVVRTRGIIAYARGDDKEAARCFQKLIECSPQVYPYGPMYGHLGCGETARINHKFDDARFHYRKADECCAGLRGRVERAYASLGLAEISRQEGQSEGALRVVLETREVGRTCGFPWLEFYSNLAGALLAFGEEQNDFLLAAAEVNGRFKRRGDDMNLEIQIYRQIAQDLAAGRPTVPFRFIYP